MIVFTPELGLYYGTELIQVRSFLDSKSVNARHYWIGPHTRSDDDRNAALVTIGYGGERYDDGNVLASMMLPMADRPVEVRCGLREAISLLTFVFDEPVYLAGLMAIDPTLTAEAALNHLGIDVPGLIRPKVADYDAGYHLAPYSGGWRLYFVEDRGEISPTADSIVPAALAYMVYASWRGQETDLSSRLAKFIPPNSAAIINGSAPMPSLR